MWPSFVEVVHAAAPLLSINRAKAIVWVHLSVRMEFDKRANSFSRLQVLPALCQDGCSAYIQSTHATYGSDSAMRVQADKGSSTVS